MNQRLKIFLVLFASITLANASFFDRLFGKEKHEEKHNEKHESKERHESDIGKAIKKIVKRQIPMAAALDSSLMDYAAYDYYDWVCSGTACQLCDVLTGACCIPSQNNNCFLPDSCANNPCLSGGTCVSTTTVGGQPDFTCVCQRGLTGKYCQLIDEFTPPIVAALPVPAGGAPGAAAPGAQPAPGAGPAPPGQPSASPAAGSMLGMSSFGNNMQGLGSQFGAGNLGSGFGSGFGSGLGNSFGSGFGSGLGSGFGSGLGTGFGGLNTMNGLNSFSSPSTFGSRTGAVGTGLSSMGLGSSFGTGMGTGMGTGLGTGLGTGFGTGMGTGLGTGLGSGLGGLGGLGSFGGLGSGLSSMGLGSGLGMNTMGMNSMGLGKRK